MNLKVLLLENITTTLAVMNYTFVDFIEFSNEIIQYFFEKENNCLGVYFDYFENKIVFELCEIETNNVLNKIEIELSFDIFDTIETKLEILLK